MATEFRILGPIEALRGEEPLPLGPRKQRALLAILLVHLGQVVSTGRLIEELWQGEPSPGAEKTLRSYISRLRAALNAAGAQGADSKLVSRPPGYVLDVDSDRLDSSRFETLVREGRDALRRGASAQAAETLREALGLWRGPALADVADWDFTRPIIARLEEVRLAAVQDRVEADLALGRHAELVGELETIGAAHPLNEQLWGQLMIALYRSGRQADALAAYHRVRKILAEELGLEPDRKLQDLYEAILRHEVRPAPAPEVPHNLPAALTSFVGRERELGDIANVLGQSRMVTLTGVGGSGKTRLALEAAVRALPDYSDGAWVVDLAPLSEPELVPLALATTLHIQEKSDRPILDVLADHLRSSRILLVVDNCEHLVDACARLAAELLPTCSRMRILATSREPLGVLGEVIYPVPPLPVPGHDPEDVETLQGSASVQLFLDRARMARPGFQPPTAALPTIGLICRILDGLPLAIELAAVRVNSLSLEDIAARIGDRFRFLRAWTRTTLPRHQTLRAAMDWSHDLLAEEERRVLRGLSVFAGGFTLEGAEAVCAGAGGGTDVLDSLNRLVGASLVVAEERQRGMRYRMLETVRQYAKERLADTGEHVAMRRRHALHFLSLTEQAWEGIDGPEEGTWFARVETEYDNVRAALAWSLGGGDGEIGPRLARGLGNFWRIHGHLQEGKSWLVRALELCKDEPTPLRADLVGALGSLYLRQNDFRPAAELLHEAVAVARESGAHWSVGHWLHCLAATWRSQRNYHQARELLAEALQIHREIGHAAGVAYDLGSLADMALEEGRLPEAARLYEEGMALLRQAGNPPVQVVAYLESMARLAMLQQDWERGEHLAEEGLTKARELGDVAHIGLNLANLSSVARSSSDLQRARSLLREGIPYFWEIRELQHVAESLESLAGVEVDAGRADRGARLLAAAAAIRKQHGVPITVSDRPRYEQDLEKIRSTLDSAAFEAAWADGASLTHEEAVRFALESEL